jgi:hypothetical protein
MKRFFLFSLTAFFMTTCLFLMDLRAAGPPPQWVGGWGSDLDVYASVSMDAWWTPGTNWTDGIHHIYIYNDEARSMSFTYEMHHELVGYGNQGGIWISGNFGSVDAGDYARRTGYPDITLTASNIQGFPGAGDYTIHSRTGLEVYHPLAGQRRDSWHVQSDYNFTYVPLN